MQNNKLVVGLDIGTTKICAVVGQKNEYGKLEILGMGTTVSEGVVTGVVTHIDKTVEAIKKVMDQARDQAGVEGKSFELNVGIAGKHIKSLQRFGSITRDTEGEEVTVEDVSRLTNDMYKTVVAAGDEIIHVLPQDYTVDHQENIVDPVGVPGVRLDANFHVITAQTNAIKNINKCVVRAGFDSENPILEPLASSLSVLSDEEKKAGVALIDIGGGTTDIAIFYDNIIRHTAVFPIGGNKVTSDIMGGCMLMEKVAEQLKIQFGSALADEASANVVVSIKGLKDRPPKEISVKTLAQIIDARMEDIIDLIRSQIISSKFADKLVAGLVITGGGALLRNLKQKVEYMTGMDARIGYPNEHLGRSKIEAVKSPMFSTVVGLVLAGFRALDDREDQYSKSSSKHYRKDKGGDFFKKIIDRTKGLLIDDFDDKTDY